MANNLAKNKEGKEVPSFAFGCLSYNIGTINFEDSINQILIIMNFTITN